MCGINAPRIVIKLLYVSLLLITALRNLLNLLNLHTFPPLDISLGRANYYRKKKHREIAKPVLVVEESF